MIHLHSTACDSLLEKLLEIKGLLFGDGLVGDIARACFRISFFAPRLCGRGCLQGISACLSRSLHAHHWVQSSVVAGPPYWGWLTKRTFCKHATPCMAFAAKIKWLHNDMPSSLYHSPAHQSARTRSKRARRLAGFVSLRNRKKRPHRSATGTYGNAGSWGCMLLLWNDGSIYLSRFTLSGAAQLRT